MITDNVNVDMSKVSHEGHSDACRWLLTRADKCTCSPPSMTSFNSGATRTSEPLEDYEGFLSPAVIREFGRYMAHHRMQADGEVRSSDNWQKGIAKKRYMRSMWRHFLDVWADWRNDRIGDALLDSLCALFFNVQGMILEVLVSTGKAKRPHIRSGDVPK